MKADLANCTEVQPLDNEEYPHDYAFTIRCNKCSFDHPKPVIVNRFDQGDIEFDRLRRTVHLAKKCKECSKLHYLILVRTPDSLTPDNNDTFVPIVEVHTHGCQVIDYSMEDQFMCKTLAGEVVEEIDLRRNEWTEFDETSNLPMTITNFSYEIEEVRGNSSLTSL